MGKPAKQCQKSTVAEPSAAPTVAKLLEKLDQLIVELGKYIAARHVQK